MPSGDTSPRSHLKIGSTGQIGNYSLHLKGYVRCMASDDEETWYWEEWYAGTDHGEELWLEYDEYTNKYSLFKKLSSATIVSEGELLTGKTVELNTGDRFVISETVRADIVDAKGELPEGHEVRTSYMYYESESYDNVAFTIEESDEIEIFKGERVDAPIVFKAFNLTGALATYEWKMDQERVWSFVRSVCFFVASCGAIALALLASKGTKVLDQTITTCTSQSSNCPAEEQLLGPVTLTKTNRVYKLDIATIKGINQQNWQAITVTLLDESMQPLSAVEGDFWEEAWSEGGESGVERNTKKDKYFRLTKTGTYYLKTTIEPASAVSKPITLSIRLYEDVMYWPYFISLIAGGLGIVGIKDKWYLGLKEL